MIMSEIQIPTGEELSRAAQELLPDLPTGPLDVYRKRASFDWKKLKLVLEGIECVKLENKLWKLLQEDPIFHHPRGAPSLDEVRRLSFLRVKRLLEYRSAIIPDDELMRKPGLNHTYLKCMGMYDWSSYVKSSLADMVFKFSLITSGTDRHSKVIEDIFNRKAIGSLILTELSHGSNLRGLATVAVYDPSTQEYVVNTPTLEATKCWVGNLGKHATHGLLFAQLYTADGQCHGLHIFVIPLRDPATQRPYPGLIIGDMGPKAGLNGIDNGFMSFHHYRISRDCLLNKISDVTPEGKYVSAIKDSTKRFSTSLATLSAGRVGIIRMCAINHLKSLIIAVRYSAVRKQFGPSANEELPVLEYQMQHWRLITQLSAAYAMDIYSKAFSEEFRTFNVKLATGVNVPNKELLSAEVHAISCCVKPLAGWLARDCIQECREACGGHGYLKMSGLSDLRNDHDANCTYEGDNNVILQQTSNYLIYLMKSKRSGVPISSPLGITGFLNDFDNIIRKTLSVDSISDILPVEVSLHAYKWLICFLLQQSEQKLTRESSKGLDSFTTRNNCQAYYLRSLALVFAEHTVLQRFHQYSHNPTLPSEIEAVLSKMCSLYGLWSLEKHLGTLYQGGYVSGTNFATLLRNSILQLCFELKDDAVSLVDVHAPPDAILNSPLGAADGQVYKHLYSALVHQPGAFDIPSWWNEYRDLSTEGSDAVLSKL